MAEKFEEKTPEIKPEEIKEEPKSKAELKKGWREHFGVMAEVQEEREGLERKEAKVKAKEWKEYFGPLTEMWTPAMKRKVEKEFAEEKESVESAKIPAEGMKTEQVLKEVGIQKTAESFNEIQERLNEKLGQARVRGGEKLSLADKNETTRDFYLAELGYSVKYKGLLRGKAELLDETGKVVSDEKGKHLEFKTFFKMGRKETPLIDFLKEKLQGKLEGKPAKELSEEEKWEEGLQKAIKLAKQEQAGREEKISSLADVKKVGRERLEKVMDGLSYMAALDKLGVLGLREGKKLAIEGGKDLVALGLSPAMAVEEAGREVAGRIKVGEALRKIFVAERKIEALERIQPEKRPEYYNKALEFVQQSSRNTTEKMIDGYDLMFEKGKIFRFLERWGGRFGKVMGERLEPHPRY